jgi:hypothetical protein
MGESPKSKNTRDTFAHFPLVPAIKLKDDEAVFLT